MRTESDHTQEIIKRLRADLPGMSVVKHCDRFTVGVPDMSVTNPELNLTIWIENKKLKKPSQKLLCPAHWLDNTAQLMMSCSLGAYYLVLDNFRGDSLFMHSRRVLRFYRERSVLAPMDLADNDEYHMHADFDYTYNHLLEFLKGALNGTNHL